jgi:hypothetical protein
MFREKKVANHTITYQPLRSERSSLFLTSFLPATIWESMPVLSPNLPSLGLYTLENLVERVYEAATYGISLPRSERKLELEGSSLTSLVTAFEEALGDAVDKGDFTHILLPHREFIM